MMGSSKKHKKHKSEKRDKYEEYSNNQDPSNIQRGLKLILKVGSNSTPEYRANSPAALNGVPTAAEAMMSEAPSSPQLPVADSNDEQHREKHKKSKKKKKKKDREKKHKHHKEKRHRSGKYNGEDHDIKDSSLTSIMSGSEIKLEPQSETNHTGQTASIPVVNLTNAKSPRNSTTSNLNDCESSQDAFSFIDDDNSQPLPENILMFARITTDSSPSCRPVSKPIVPRKIEELQAETNSNAAVPPMATGLSNSTEASISPTKPLPDIIIPSLSPSPSMNAATTPGAASSHAGLTPKMNEAPKTPNTPSSESGREPRTCVLKLKQQKSPLVKLLDHLLRFLEKRDPHQYFAWPVTDDIAPGYSSIITKPMDFSTMRQKIEDSEYSTLSEFIDDFKLMCDNAIRYNYVETVYHKAAKRLLQVGMKHLTPENLMRSLKPLSGYLRELTSKELGFELIPGEYGQFEHMDSADECASSTTEEPTQAQIEEEEKRKAIRLENEPKTHFEPYVDDLTHEEILAQVKNASISAKKKLSAKQRAQNMGFLRQHKDGTTSLNVLIKDENDGPEKVISIGDLVGKLKAGSCQLQGLREDKRNDAHLVKGLNYGPFASFAPIYDSRFSSLSKEETQLVLRTYGDTTAAEYAESILQFSKDSSYASQLANGLLDILTNGEHSKGMEELQELQLQNYEERELMKCFNNSHTSSSNIVRSNIKSHPLLETKEQIEEEYEKYKNTRIDFSRLRTLDELGIDVSFLDSVESEMKDYELSRRLQEHLSTNLNLIEKLRAAQHERLSQPLPMHLALVPQPSLEENHLAQQITQQLTDVAKKLPPSAIADAYGLRKAMGMSYAGLPPLPQGPARIPLPEILQQPVSLPQINLNDSSALPIPMDIDDSVVGTHGVDLEDELREFLESGGSALHNANSSNEDSNLVTQLLLN